MEIQRFVKYKYLSNKKNHKTTMSTPTTFIAVLHKEENMYIAECPEVGTVSQGETIEEAINNLGQIHHNDF